MYDIGSLSALWPVTQGRSVTAAVGQALCKKQRRWAAAHAWETRRRDGGADGQDGQDEQRVVRRKHVGRDWRFTPQPCVRRCSSA